MEPAFLKGYIKVFITRTIIRFILWILTLFSITTLAIFLYASFYLAYIPNASLTKPVYLLFRTDCDNKGQGLCSFPSANISLQIEQPQERILMRGQPYRIYLNLDMPYSPVNQNLGMFMVQADFLADSGTVIATSSRSCMLHYQSWMLRYLKIVVYFLPLVFGWAEEKQNINILLFERYMDNTYHPASSISVVIMAKQIEVYSASITFEASFSGIRYIMYNWPITSAAIAISLNLASICFITVLACKKDISNEVNDQEDGVSSAISIASSTQSETPLTTESSQEGIVPGESVQDIPERPMIGVAATNGRLKVSPLKRRAVRKRFSGQRVSFCSLPRNVHGERPGLRCRKFPLNRSKYSAERDTESYLSPERDNVVGTYYDEISISSSKKTTEGSTNISESRGKQGPTANPAKQSPLVRDSESFSKGLDNDGSLHLQKHIEGIARFSSEDSLVQPRGDVDIPEMFSLRETKSESCLSDLKYSDASVERKLKGYTPFNLYSLWCSLSVQSETLASKANWPARNRYIRRQSFSSETEFDDTETLSCTRSAEHLDTNSYSD